MLYSGYVTVFMCSNKYGATCAIANSSYTKIDMQKYSRVSDNKIPTKIKELKPIMRYRNVLFSNIPNTGTGNVCTCIRVYACMGSFLQPNTIQYNAIGRWFSTRFLHKCNRKLFGDAFFYSFVSHAIHIERRGTRHSTMFMHVYIYIHRFHTQILILASL